MFAVKALAGGLAHVTPAPNVYLLLAHAAHGPPAIESKPALHGLGVQAAKEVLPVSDTVSSGQS